MISRMRSVGRLRARCRHSPITSSIIAGETEIIMRIQQAEYIWLDGARPTQRLRSKSRIIALSENDPVSIESFPDWSFDGSSTYQSSGNNSDLFLKPVRFLKDPLRVADNFLVLCEVFNADGSAHATNTRAGLRLIMDAGGAQAEPWIGFEQEYTLLNGTNPL